MDKLRLMEIFVRIVETGSFSAVAREIGMTPAHGEQADDGARAQSQDPPAQPQHPQPEPDRGRALPTTSAAARSSTRCSAAEISLGALQGTLGGTLSVNSSVALRSDVPDPPRARVPERLHPDVSVVLTLNDRYIDLVEEGIDVAIRFGRLVDSSLVARRVAGFTGRAGGVARVPRASAAYPQHPSELTRHSCLHYTYLSTGNEWVFPVPARRHPRAHLGALPLQQRLRAARCHALRSRHRDHAAGVRPAGAETGRGGPGTAGVHQHAAAGERGLSLGPLRLRQGAHLRRFLQERLPRIPGLLAPVVHASAARAWERVDLALTAQRHSPFASQADTK